MFEPLRLLIEEPSGLRREGWPVTRGVPLPESAVRSCEELRVLHPAGCEVPLQAQALGAPWPDGTLRWVLLHFQADLAPQARAEYRLVFGLSGSPSTAGRQVRVAQEGATITVDTGPLVATLRAEGGFGLVEQAWLNGRAMLAEGERPGFVLEEGSGRRYSTGQGRVERFEIEEAGPVRAVVHVVGDHRDGAGSRLFGYEMRIYAHAGQPWLEVEYTFVNDADEEHTELREISWEVAPAVGGVRRGLCGAYQDLYESEDGFMLYGDRDSSAGVFAGLRIYDAEGRHVEYAHAGEMSHRIAQGWIDISNGEAGLLAGVAHAAELYPKGLAYTGAGVRVDVWPARAGVLRLHQGMARTHRLLLLFHDGSGRAAEVNKTFVRWEQDLRAWIPGWYVQSEAMGPVLAYAPEKYPHIEMALRDQYSLWRSSNRALGFLDFGDCPQLGGTWEAYGYMANNQLDLAHVLALQYARTGEAEYFQDLESVAWHLMDVDIVHHTTHDPVELGGARIQGNGHVQYNCEGYEDISVATSQMWTEGLLEYYFLSGHPRALEIARSIGACFLRFIERGWAVYPYKIPWHGSRDTAWPLITFLALYGATGEAVWLEAARRLAENLFAAQGEDGSWDMWWGFARAPAPLHLGITLSALTAYHRLTGDEHARASLLRAADAMLERCATPDGSLIYVAIRGQRWDYYSGVAFESLGYAWELTGDERYLKAGWPGHRQALETNGRFFLGSAIANQWRGNLRYMYWADRAGLLRDLAV